MKPLFSPGPQIGTIAYNYNVLLRGTGRLEGTVSRYFLTLGFLQPGPLMHMLNYFCIWFDIAEVPGISR